MTNKTKKIVFVICCATILATSLTGCRQSPVLVDNLYTQEPAETDPMQIAAEPEPEGEESDVQDMRQDPNGEDLDRTDNENMAAVYNNSSLDRGNSSNVNANDQAVAAGSVNNSTNPDQVNPAAQNGDRGGNVDGAQSSEDSQSAVTSDGDDTNKSNTGGNGGSSGNGSDDQQTQPDQKVDPINPTESLNPDDSTDPTDFGGNTQITPVHKDVPKKMVTYYDGDYQYEVPDDVFTVTAVGQAVPIVEMLGGSNRLLAIDAETSNNPLVQELCPDIGAGTVQKWWTGDGSDPISADYFQELLRQSPDVCVEISGQGTFTSEQISTLQEYGIGYLPLPDFTSVSNIVDAVNILALALETNERTGESSIAIANRYREWIESSMNQVHTPGFQYVVFAADWRDDVAFWRDPHRIELYPSQYGWSYPWKLPSEAGINDEGYGTGVAIGYTHQMQDKTPIDELLDAAHIREAGTMSTMSSKDEVILFPYQGDGMVAIQHYYSDEFEVLHTNGDYDLVGSGDPLQGIGNNFGSVWDDELNSLYSLGDANYKYIIAHDSRVYERMISSWFWKYYDQSARKSFYSYMDEEQASNAATYISSVHGDFYVLLNPCGLGNWSDGSVDCPLEMFWAATRIQHAMNETSLKRNVTGFYRDFFGVTISDARYQSIVY